MSPKLRRKAFSTPKQVLRITPLPRYGKINLMIVSQTSGLSDV